MDNQSNSPLKASGKKPEAEVSKPAEKAGTSSKPLKRRKSNKTNQDDLMNQDTFGLIGCDERKYREVYESEEEEENNKRKKKIYNYDGEFPSLNTKKNPESVNSIWQMPANFSRYLVIAAKDDSEHLKKMSPIKIEKIIHAACIMKPVSVEKTGKTILVHVNNARDCESLIQMSTFNGTPVVVSLHRNLNYSKGVVTHWDLAHMTEDDWTQVEGIVKADQLLRDNRKTKTGTWFLTFDTNIPPSVLRVGYLTNIKVRPYIPKPMRCHNCHRFGHLGKYCHKPARCIRCG